jgi:hypothetical protein
VADQYQVKFRGDTLLSASEGEQHFKRGLLGRRVIVDDVIGGAAIKDGCQGTGTHELTLEFLTTTVNAAAIEAAVYARLQAIWDGIPGTLEVPEFVPLPNCVVVDIDLSQQERIAQPTPLNTPSSTFSDGVSVVAVIQFIQTD